MAYLFDTSAILEAKNRYYSFEVCPGFWTWLARERSSGNILSIDAVRKELEDPDASDWARANSIFFELEDIGRLTEVSACVMNEARIKTEAKFRFLAKADPLLIAHALAHNHTIVTHEVAAPGAIARVTIPDVCRQLNVPCVNTFYVLSELRARFILET